MKQMASSASQQAAAIVEFWRMAGVDYIVQDHAASWLDTAEPAKSAAAAHHETRTALPPRADAAHGDARRNAYGDDAAMATPSADWPETAEQLSAMIGGGAALPGNQYGGGSARPAGPADARLMIISDLPDFDEIAAGTLGQCAYGRLLANMVRAAGYDMADCYLTALATTRPAAGDLPDGAAPLLLPFIMHQIKIVRPKAVLVLGSAACGALFGAELMTARGNLHYFNQDGRKLASVVTFHPRTLLARPILKAQAWKDLQMLMNKEIL